MGRAKFLFHLKNIIVKTVYDINKGTRTNGPPIVIVMLAPDGCVSKRLG